MNRSQAPKAVLETIRRGTVIPATPLALNARRQFDERRQRALMRELAKVMPLSAIDTAMVIAIVPANPQPLPELNADLGLPRFGACRGVSRKSFEANCAKMAAVALASGRPANNPRQPSAEEVAALYHEAR